MNNIGISIDRNLNFRSAKQACDPIFAFDLYSETARKNIERVKGYWCETEQQSFFMNGFCKKNSLIIMHNGERVGCFTMIEHEKFISLQRMYVVPKMQGGGIGTRVMDFAISVAASQNKPLDLEVLFTNTKAYHFYKKLGFRVIYEKPTGYGMRLLVQ